jgi:Cu/Ag efflux protein CusF
MLNYDIGFITERCKCRLHIAYPTTFCGLSSREEDHSPGERRSESRELLFFVGGMKMKQLAMLALIVLSLLGVVACTPNQPSAEKTQSARRYHFKGKVVSVDKQAHMLNVNGEAIPGFMSAMTMPYNVKPESQLDKLSPGDAIAADVVVQGDDSWLENITVTGHSAASSSK